jgi:DNA polymerase III delta prime subunit
MKIEQKSIKVASKSKPIEITVLSSVYHIELNPSDSGFNDRYVIQEVIKEIASSRSLDTLTHRSFKGNFNHFFNFLLHFNNSNSIPEFLMNFIGFIKMFHFIQLILVVVLHEVDRLTKSAQHALR